MNLLNYDVAKKWFTWVEWVTLTAAIWAIGETSNSWVILGVAYVSAIIVMVSAWASFDTWVEDNLSEPDMVPKLLRGFLRLAVGIFPVLVMYFVGSVIQSILQGSGTT
jgi:hypothetical protein